MLYEFLCFIIYCISFLSQWLNSARIISCFGCVVCGWTTACWSWTAHWLDVILISCYWALNGPALEAVLLTLMMKATNSMLSYQVWYVDYFCVQFIELCTNELMSNSWILLGKQRYCSYIIFSQIVKHWYFSASKSLVNSIMTTTFAPYILKRALLVKSLFFHSCASDLTRQAS